MTNDQETLGAFEIVEKIGSGGMASVYKAYQPRLERYVAIKVMHPNIASDENFLARFEREAKIVAKLDHPHIVPIYDIDDIDGNPFIVMKYIDGQTLRDVLRAGPVQPDFARRIMRAAADALDYAHQNGVLHRDVKPSNILIDSRQYPYLADFGLARVTQQGEGTLSTDVMLGTPHYVSPEQARGDANLDGRTDVYSLGVVFYELLTGRLPFTGDTFYAIIHAQINDVPPAPRSINPAIPAEVETVLLRALAKDPQDRYTTARAMMDAYEEAVADHSVSAPSSQIVPKGQSPADMKTLEEKGMLSRIKQWGQEKERQLQSALTSLDQTTGRNEAIKTLGMLKDPRATDALMGIFRKKDTGGAMAYRGRQLAAEALGQIGDPRALSVLLLGLEDAHSSVKATSAESLARLNDPRAIAPMIALLDDPSPAVRLAALKGLTKLAESHEVDTTPIVEHLADPDDTVRKASADALRAMGTQVLSALIAGLKHPNSTVRGAAADLLGDLGAEEAAELLKQVKLNDSSRWVQSRADEALKKLPEGERDPNWGIEKSRIPSPEDVLERLREKQADWSDLLPSQQTQQTPPPPSAPSDPKAMNADQIRALLDQLDLRLVNGEISEATYERLSARWLARLKDLGEG